MNEDGQVHAVSLRDWMQEDSSGTMVWIGFEVWADPGVEIAIERVAGTSIMDVQDSRYYVKVDPRFDHDSVSQEIYSNIHEYIAGQDMTNIVDEVNRFVNGEF